MTGRRQSRAALLEFDYCTRPSCGAGRGPLKVGECVQTESGNSELPPRGGREAARGRQLRDRACSAEVTPVRTDKTLVRAEKRSASAGIVRQLRRLTSESRDAVLRERTESDTGLGGPVLA
jgi:hypothetical protein